MKKKVSSIISYAVPAIIILVLDCIILGIQHIWPFGNTTIDFYDMAQQLASEYLQIYDEMHGAKSMYYDFFTCLGHGLPGGTYLSIFSLYLYFLPRNMILQGFSIAFIFKTMLMALTMRIFLKKEKACPDFFGIILSAGYGLCGFTLMQYTIISWLDIAILVPLIVMYAIRLVRDGKAVGYIVCVTLMMLVSFYVPAMCLMFLALETGIYLLSELAGHLYNGGKIKNFSVSANIFRLGISTLVSLMLSAFMWVPKVFEASSSQRFSNESESGIIAFYTKILTHVQPDYSTRWWCLLGLSFSFAVIAVGVVRDLKRKNVKRIVFTIGSLGILLLELLFENIQLMWHFGSYVNYPVRNGFLFYIVGATLAAEYLGEILKNEDGDSLPIVLPMGGIVVMILLASAGVLWYMANPGMSVYTVFRVSAICAMVCFLIYLFLIKFKSGRYLKLCVFLIMAEMIFYGVLTIGKPTYITGYSEEPEQEGEYIRIAQELKKELEIYDSALDRIKNPDTSLNTNYGNFMKRATLSGWVPTIAPDVINSAYTAGYSTQYTRLLDSGGNAFTDALFHITQAVTFKELDDNLYEKLSSTRVVIDPDNRITKEYSLYNARYTLPFGTIVKDISLLDNISNAGGSFDFTNAAYRGISPEGDDIAEKFELRDGCVKVKGCKLLYLTGYCADSDYENVRIIVNDRVIEVPSLKEPDNTYYPAHFNNNLLYLGCFTDETVAIEYEYDLSKEGHEYLFDIYGLDVNKLQSLCSYYEKLSPSMGFTADKRFLEATVNSEGDEYLLLPIGYSEDFKTTVNGLEVKLIPVTGILVAVPLVKGENYIKLAYFSEFTKLGILISILGAVFVLAALSLMSLGDKKSNIACRKIAANILLFEDKTAQIFVFIYLAVFAIVILIMYILPVIYGLYYYAMRIVGH